MLRDRSLVCLASFETEKLKSQTSFFTYSNDLTVDTSLSRLGNEDNPLVDLSLVFGKLFYLFDFVGILDDFWNAEKAFRISKSDLSTRPIYHRNENRIKAHICICFMAYALYKDLERRLKINKTNISIEKAIDLINDISEVTYTLPKSQKVKSKLLELTEMKSKILELVKI